LAWQKLTDLEAARSVELHFGVRVRNKQAAERLLACASRSARGGPGALRDSLGDIHDQTCVIS